MELKRLSELVMVAVWLLGLGITAYLVVVTYTSNVCLAGGMCESKLSLAGFTWFVLAPVAIRFKPIRRIWQITGVAGIVLLVATEVLTQFCTACSLAHVSGALLIGLSVVYEM